MLIRRDNDNFLMVIDLFLFIHVNFANIRERNTTSTHIAHSALGEYVDEIGLNKWASNGGPKNMKQEWSAEPLLLE